MLRGLFVGRIGRVVAGCPLLLVLAATLATCAGKAKPDRWVKVARLRDEQLVSRANLPICLPDSSESLADRERLNTCMRAIKSKGIAVARDDSQPCLAATMVFATTSAGAEGECTSYLPGGPVMTSECSSRKVYQHKLKVVLSDPDDESTVLESYAATEIGKGTFDTASISALCKGAFHRYPQPMRGQMINLNDK